MNEDQNADISADVLASDPSPLDSEERHATGVTSTDRPEGLPEKFWDEETETVRTDAMVKSYLNLEKRLGGQGSERVPASAADYDIQLCNSYLEQDEHLNNRLHSAGFTQPQAQLVYDLASEHLYPLVTQMAADLEAQTQVSKLTEEFGGPERWNEISGQIANWGKSNYPEDVYRTMASSVDGVRSMYQMMISNSEPGLVDHGQFSEGAPTEKSLKALMRDPRYWRDQDPTLVSEVREGFEKLYPRKD